MRNLEMSLWQWFVTLISLKPHFVIGDQDKPYMLRWYLIPRNSYVNLYLHKFLRDDEDRALHNHPWWFVSFLIWGRYDEIVSDDGTQAIYRNSPSIAFRSAEHKHRVVLPRIVDWDYSNGTFTESRKPAWTIVMTGPKTQEWGFFCPKGFVPWYDFVDRSNTGSMGKGCDDE